MMTLLTKYRLLKGILQMYNLKISTIFGSNHSLELCYLDLKKECGIAGLEIEIAESIGKLRITVIITP